MKKSDYTKKTTEELIKELATLKAEVAESAFGKTLGKTADLKAYRAKRKEIARIMTFLNQK